MTCTEDELLLDRPSGHDLLVVQPATAATLRTLGGGLRTWLAEQRWPAEAAEDVEIAAGEALANVVDHAYLPGSPGPAHLHAWTAVQGRERRVVVTVTDRGRWARHHPPAPAGVRGRGLVLMNACTAELHVLRGAGGTTVIMVSRPCRPTG